MNNMSFEKVKAGGVNENELNRIIEYAVDKRFDCVEIIPPDIFAQREIAEQTIKFLNRAEIKSKFSRCDIDEISGRIYIYFESG